MIGIVVECNKHETMIRHSTCWGSTGTLFVDLVNADSSTAVARIEKAFLKVSARKSISDSNTRALMSCSIRIAGCNSCQR